MVIGITQFQATKFRQIDQVIYTQMLTALKQNMDVIAHENPSVNFAFALSDILAEVLQKTEPILFVFEDVSLIDTPHHDMVQGAGYIQSGLAWHGQFCRNPVRLSRDLHV
jgi:hypothetical protein